MTNADRIEDETTELQLWMLPLILFHLIRSFFAGERDFLCEHRSRQTDLPDWEDHIPDLVTAEWHIASIKAEGARRLLAGQDIAFNTIRIPPPPDDWRPALVDGPQDLLRRFEAVAAFHADPEAAIRAHAASIALAATSPLRQSLRACHLPQSFRLREATRKTDLTIAGIASLSLKDWGRWIARPCAQDGGGSLGMPRPIPP